ncbi:MAG: MFS transporter, partial [Planctomycetota bacterium]|nr:MFS transporter [Planctomycetota bacterium]
MQHEISDHDKKFIFWASFLSLAAASTGFVYRVMSLGTWAKEFEISFLEVGRIFGASLWPIAITMIIGSLLIVAIGHKKGLYGAFILQAASVFLTAFADSPRDLWWGAFCAGLGHGFVEAVINPVCATIYPKEKTKMLAILHAAWPAGMVGGGILMLLPGLDELHWTVSAYWMLIPVIVYGVMLWKPTFPIDERVAANVSYRDMLKEAGFLSAFLASFLMFYELYRQLTGSEPASLLWTSLAVGLVIGIGFGLYTRSVGKVLYFFLCVLMIPLATTELGTDAWIKELMTPSMGAYAGWAIVLSAFIMMILRFQAGHLTKRFSAPTILVISSFFSLCGLMTLSVSSGLVVILAFVLYAVGQTFYWPAVLGFASEQYPRGGALTLNTVSAIGLLAVGILGTPIMGAFHDNHTTNNVKAMSTEIHAAARTDGTFFGKTYESIDRAKAEELATA